MAIFKVVTCNVNGLRAAERKGFFSWITALSPDVVCVQETKAQCHQLEGPAFRPQGYHAYFVEAEKIFLELKNFYPTNKDILKNLSICFFQNRKFKECENIIKNMLDLGFKERKLLEYLLLVFKKQDNVKEILNLTKIKNKFISIKLEDFKNKIKP